MEKGRGKDREGFLFFFSERRWVACGECQLAMGSISTDKALPCRCEEFQLNIQPICLCVGEGFFAVQEESLTFSSGANH